MSTTDLQTFHEHAQQFDLLNRETFDMVENEIAAGLPDIMLDLLDTFLTDSQETLASMIEGLSSASYGNLERNAHSLKSTFATFGAERGAAYFGRMESLARQGDFAQIGELIAPTRQVYQQSRQIFEQERERIAAAL